MEKLKIDWDNSITHYTKLENYYGCLTLVEYDNKFYMMLDDHSSTSYIEIDIDTFNKLLQYKDSESIKL